VNAGSDFSTTLAQAVQTLDGIQRAAGDQVTRLATGEAIDIHDVMIAQEWAGLSLSLALQVRNKLVESYQEVMRMQV
jgi:flagellar hook-basal body complex protein FliE